MCCVVVFRALSPPSVEEHTDDSVFSGTLVHSIDIDGSEAFSFSKNIKPGTVSWNEGLPNARQHFAHPA